MTWSRSEASTLVQKVKAETVTRSSPLHRRMFHVKHSQIEPEPAAAEKLCGEALPTLRLFAEHLAQWGEELGLVGPRELIRLWTRHILELSVSRAQDWNGTLIDIGSGAGFPGLVIRPFVPDVQCTLIEPLGRRAHWLREEADRLGLSNVEVRNERAEEAAGSRDRGLCDGTGCECTQDSGTSGGSSLETGWPVGSHEGPEGGRGGPRGGTHTREVERDKPRY